MPHRPKIVLLPGWWYELLGGVSGLACLAVLLAIGARFPAIVPLALFTALLVVAENSSIILPSEASVSPAFMIVMAAIAAFGPHGAILGASVEARFRRKRRPADIIVAFAP